MCPEAETGRWRLWSWSSASGGAGKSTGLLAAGEGPSWRSTKKRTDEANKFWHLSLEIYQIIPNPHTSDYCSVVGASWCDIYNSLQEMVPSRTLGTAHHVKRNSKRTCSRIGRPWTSKRLCLQSHSLMEELSFIATFNFEHWMKTRPLVTEGVYCSWFVEMKLVFSTDLPGEAVAWCCRQMSNDWCRSGHLLARRRKTSREKLQGVGVEKHIWERKYIDS